MANKYRFFCIFWFCILWTFKTWYLFAIYQFNHMYHILLSISYLLSYYFWKSINKWRNGGDLKLRSFFLVIDLAHSANFTMATIEECGLQLLEHPPNSPDLAPSDFFIPWNEEATERPSLWRQKRDLCCHRGVAFSSTAPFLLWRTFQGQEQMAEMYIFGWWLGWEIKVSMQKI